MALLPDIPSQDYNAFQAQQFAATTQPLLDSLANTTVGGPATPSSPTSTPSAPSADSSLTPSSTFVPPTSSSPPAAPDLALSPNQQTVAAGGTPSLRSRNLISNQFSYQADQELTPQEAASACGPTAALAFARYAGRNPTIGEALSLAKEVGWSPSLGMAGPQSEVSLLGSLGVSSQYNQGAAPADVAAEVSAGRPVILDTPNHYYAVDDFNPQTGLFHVGGSGLALRGGSEWMSWAQIAQHGAGVRGSITLGAGERVPPEAAAGTRPARGAPWAPAPAASSGAEPFAQFSRRLIQSLGAAPGDGTDVSSVAPSASSAPTPPLIGGNRPAVTAGGSVASAPSFAAFSQGLIDSLTGSNPQGSAPSPTDMAASPTDSTANSPHLLPNVQASTVGGATSSPGYNDMAGADTNPPGGLASLAGQPPGIQAPQPAAPTPESTSYEDLAGARSTPPVYATLPGMGRVDVTGLPPGSELPYDLANAAVNQVNATASRYDQAFTPSQPRAPGAGPFSVYTPEQQQAQNDLGLNLVLGVAGDGIHPTGEASAPFIADSAGAGAQQAATASEGAAGASAGAESDQWALPANQLARAQSTWSRLEGAAQQLGESLDFPRGFLQDDLAAIPHDPATPEYAATAADTLRQHAADAISYLRNVAAQRRDELAASRDAWVQSIDPGLASLTKLINPRTGDFDAITVKAYKDLTGKTIAQNAIELGKGGVQYVNPDYALDELAIEHGADNAEQLQAMIRQTVGYQRKLADVRAQLRQLDAPITTLQQARKATAADAKLFSPPPAAAAPAEPGGPSILRAPTSIEAANGPALQEGSADQAALQHPLIDDQIPGAHSGPRPVNGSADQVALQHPLIPGQTSSGPPMAGDQFQVGSQPGLAGVPEPPGPVLPTLSQPSRLAWLYQVLAPAKNTAPEVQKALRSFANNTLGAQVDAQSAALQIGRTLGKDDTLASAARFERTGQLVDNPTPAQTALASTMRSYGQVTGDLGRERGYIRGNPVQTGQVAAYFPHLSDAPAGEPGAISSGGRSLSPKDFFSQSRTVRYVDQLANPVDSVSGPFGHYALHVQTSDAKYRLVQELKQASPTAAIPYKPGETHLPPGWVPGSAADPQLSQLAFPKSVAEAIQNITSGGRSRYDALNAVQSGLATAKETLFSLSGFHTITLLRQAYRANDPLTAAKVIKQTLVNTVNPEAFARWRTAPDTVQAMGEAARSGVTGLAGGTSADLGARVSTGITGQLVRAGVSGLTSGASAYASAKNAGADDQTALQRAALFGAVGAFAGPTLGRAISDSLWQRAVPTLKLLTYESARAATSDPDAAASFVNRTFGGNNLGAIARSPGVQTALRSLVLAPDWWEGWARQAGALAEGAPGVGKASTGNLSRAYWLRTAVVDGAFGLEGLNYAINGHFTDQNDPGHQFQLETTGLYNALGWPHVDAKGIPYRTYLDTLGPIGQVLSAAAATGQGGLGRAARSHLSLPLSLAAGAISNTDYRGRPIVPPGTNDAAGLALQVGHGLAQVAPVGPQQIDTTQRAGEPLPVQIGATLTGLRTSHGGDTTEQLGALLPDSTMQLLADNNATVTDGPVGKTIRGVPLATSERAKYDQLATKYADQNVRALVATPEFQKYTPPQRSKAASNEIAKARAQAAAEVLQSIPPAEIQRRLSAKGK